ncbi:MAG: sugar kinase [Thioclava sp.]|nr:sugar kinase [Thioclava sp.]|tara:strand:+ start:9770 stop:10708 length:939 start_codon:yes stop_codon:yes gene_type:complete
MSSILVVGSLGYDTITTPLGRRENILGGSANYFSLASSIFAPVRIVGVVGEDYKSEDMALLEARSIDTQGLQKVNGETFFWEGRYEDDMNEAITVETRLNVFQDFKPELPESYKASEFVFLANIDPELQMDVLSQLSSKVFVGADTMNFWIGSKRAQLENLISKVDVLLINEGECRQLTKSNNIVHAVKSLTEMGVESVVVKRGEYGFMLYSQGQYFMLPAFPVAEVIDPTGAGDTFAGGFFGYLAGNGKRPTIEHLKEACVYGCLLASYTVQDFGVAGVARVTKSELDSRLKNYAQMVSGLPKGQFEAEMR